MPDENKPIIIVTRGSALALTQAHFIAAQCRAAFPEQAFEIVIIKTTGDKLQRASLAGAGTTLPKGLFTKELETALLEGKGDLAVHSLKDLPTDLPEGLTLGAVSRREDVRDVLVMRTDHPGLKPGGSPVFRSGPIASLSALPRKATIATSSTRRRAQLLELRPDLQVVEIRGNVGTRLSKLAANTDLDATLLAAAGLVRLGLSPSPNGELKGPDLPEGLIAGLIEVTEVLPCVGQAALGIETRLNDPRIEKICAALDHRDTHRCVLAERSFLRSLGGGCQSPVGALARLTNEEVHLSGVTYQDGKTCRGELQGDANQAEQIGERLAQQVLGTV